MHVSTPTEQSLIRQAGFTYFPIALMARLPFAMMVVGLLTLVVATRGSLMLGGAVSAVAGLGTAFVGPLLGALADRRGQRSVLLIVGIANSLALLAMAWIVYSAAPDGAVLVIAFLIGATAPQVSPMSRSRLVGIITRGFSAQRATRVLGPTMAYESTADEVVFVFGPVLVGALATTLNPAAPIIGAAALTAVFVTAFALHRTGKTAPGSRETPVVQAPARELLRPALMVTIVGTFGVGLFFGSMLTSLLSFMSELGAPEQAGLVYGAMGLGSAVFALAAAWFSPRFVLGMRWMLFSAIALAGTLMLPSVESLAACAAVLLVIGIGVGPTLVTLYHLAAERSPLGRSATVMTLLSTGIVVGQSITSAITGWVGESFGSGQAFAITGGAAAIIFAASVGNALLTRHSSSASE